MCMRMGGGGGGGGCGGESTCMCVLVGGYRSVNAYRCMWECWCVCVWV